MHNIVRVSAMLIAGLPVLFAASCGTDKDDPSVTGTATETASAAGATTDVTPAPSSTPTSTSDWKTFTNTDYGFSFQYPAGWYLDVHGSHRDTTMDYIAISNYPTRPSEVATPAADLSWMELYVVPNPAGLSLGDWVTQFHAMPGEPTDRVASSQDITVAGRAGIEQTVVEGYAPVAVPAYEHYFALTKEVLVASGPAAESPWLPTYKQIVNSLVFSRVP